MVVAQSTRDYRDVLKSGPGAHFPANFCIVHFFDRGSPVSILWRYVKDLGKHP